MQVKAALCGHIFFWHLHMIDLRKCFKVRKKFEVKAFSAYGGFFFLSFFLFFLSVFWRDIVMYRVFF